VPGIEAGGVWDERHFRRIDLAHCASMIHNEASPEQLFLSTDWLSWGTYGDDSFPVVFGAGRDLAAAMVCVERMSLFMPLDAGAMPEPVGPLERGLADLWRRTAGPMSVPARRVFRTAVEDMARSWLWELVNQAQHRIPDPVDYVEMRRRTFGSDLTISLSRLANFTLLPDEIYHTRTMRELETAAQDHACFTNDLFSYQKEIEYEGELHNMVLVVEHFLGVDRIAARDVVVDLMTARIRQFEHLAANELPVLFEEFDLDEPSRKLLTGHAEGLKDWMAGILEWHRRCARYTDSELRALYQPSPPPDFRIGPTGLGTSAARLTPG
jgi:germacradienol/geosmin synthase